MANKAMLTFRTNIILRIAFDIAMLVGVFIVPFWAFSVVALAGLIYFNDFYEFIAVFAMRDFLYALPEVRFAGSVYIMTLASVLVFFAVNFIKGKVLLTR